MLKLIFSLLLILFLLCGGVYFLLFMQSGNNILQPFVQKYISEKIGKEVVFKKFAINPNAIDLQAVIDQKSSLDVRGKLNILKQSFNLAYHIDAKEIETPQFTIKKQLLIDGSAKGKIDDFITTGKGQALKSNITYAVNIIKNLPTNINLDIDHGSIEAALLLAGQKPYAKGAFDLHIKMPKFDTQKLTLNAILNLQNGVINEKMVYEDFQISLPKNTTYHGTFAAAANESQNVNVKGDLYSSLANMHITKGVINTQTQDMDVNYLLDIKDLAKLEPIIDHQLKGDVKITGDAQKRGQKITVRGNANEFGGKVAFVMKDMLLDITAEDISVVKLSEMLVYPKVFEAAAKVNVHYNLLTKQGAIAADMQTARALPSQFTSLLATFTNTDLTKEKFNDTTFNAKINKENVNFTFQAKSKKSYIALKESHLNTKTNQINSKFDVDIKDKDLKGTITGDINKPKIAIEGSEYLKQKASKELNKLIDKHLGSDDNGSDKAKPVKDLLKMFLK